MAKHRAPVSDRRARRERTGNEATHPADLSQPVPRQDRESPRPDFAEAGLTFGERREWAAPRQNLAELWPGPPYDRSGGGPAPQQRPLNAPGVLGRTPVVGVARVPATSRLTPPGREIRNQGPRPVRRPGVVPAPAGRHRRAAEPDC
ncbi:hypothetical protein ACGFIK_26990 [Micromonospora sp. NPDC048871]|uniref:hypothetical protein n=1 Tax=Micromonospora sp. NPDC048871 TaxID=3364259 RepID=UPI0037183206